MLEMKKLSVLVLYRFTGFIWTGMSGARGRALQNYGRQIK